ncbi:MAG: MBL fold metallo-hydrolase [Lachnospiraceae bacterium]|nr:MBL fold metallo-hydrolase [Lachnospiraceae bacterium]
MNLVSITSGSSGNCIYVGSNNTHILVDAGISGKRIETGLNSIGLKPEELSGILVTHEHADHIQGIGVMSRRYGIPIYATKGTISGILDTKAIGEIPAGLFNIIEPDGQFLVNDLIIDPVRISHDAREPVAYRIGHEKSSVGICTDLGVYDDYIVDSFRGVNAILIEANHDVNMLQVGRYPYSLKRRILSDKGHLSNENSGRLLCELLHDDLSAILLGHLSEENNLAELAYETVRLEILMSECKYKPEDFELMVASRTERSKLIAV